MLETRLLVSNAARSGAHSCHGFLLESCSLGNPGSTTASRNWMCFSGVICGQRVVLCLRSSVSFAWGASSSPCEFMVQPQGTCSCSASGEAVTFHRKSHYGGFYAHTDFIQWHAETFLMTHTSAVMGHQSECPAQQSCAWPKMPACPSTHPNAIMA